MQPIVVTPIVVIPQAALSASASRSGGPGGQHVNKTSTKVELRVDLGAIVGLTDEQYRRLVAKVRGKVDDEGRLLVTSQETRSQAMNLETAREKVRELVASALVRPKRRIPTKPSRGAKARRLSDKRRQGEKKEGRRFSGD